MDGTQFDSSHTRGKPYEFVLGQGAVIACWEKAFETMRKGEKAFLTCAPQYAYGVAGSPSGNIPGGSTIRFEVFLESFSPDGVPNGKSDEAAAEAARKAAELKKLKDAVARDESGLEEARVQLVAIKKKLEKAQQAYESAKRTAEESKARFEDAAAADKTLAGKAASEKEALLSGEL